MKQGGPHMTRDLKGRIYQNWSLFPICLVGTYKKKNYNQLMVVYRSVPLEKIKNPDHSPDHLPWMMGADRNLPEFGFPLILDSLIASSPHQSTSCPEPSSLGARSASKETGTWVCISDSVNYCHRLQRYGNKESKACCPLNSVIRTISKHFVKK